jgi:TRAP-type C4-dicarboxylate transport system permease small subunit
MGSEAILLAWREVAPSMHWGATALGRPVGAMAVVLPAGMLVAQIALVVGVSGALLQVRQSRRSQAAEGTNKETQGQVLP